MFKKFLIGALAAVIVVAAAASAYTALAAPAVETVTETVADAQLTIVADSLSVESATDSVEVAPAADPAVDTVTTTILTADETAGLLFMYEEEKLARDVYNALFALWGQTTFQSIAASEQAHMDSVKVLLDRYGIAAPSSIAGSYSDPALQSLYNSLMNSGSRSLADALKVGATIEEVDIIDLQSRLAMTTTSDIQLVYSNLMNGSFNHLRSFVTVLQRLNGETYQPQYLDADLYQTIINGTTGNGTTTGGRSHGSGAGASTGTTTSTGGKGRGYRGGQ